MKYWDASALVPLFLDESHSSRVHRIVADDANIVTWWGTSVECVSALWMAKRQGRFEEVHVSPALERLERLLSEADMIPPTTWVRERAERLLAVHPLRAADSFQLAASLRWAQEEIRGLEFVSLDSRLRSAALAEGFTVLPE